MTEEEFIESRIQYWKDLRNRFLKHYQELDGVVDEETLSKVGEIIATAEQRITELRKQLPPPMSQRQLRAIEEIPEVWAEVTGNKLKEEALCKAADKTLQEYADIAAGKDLKSTAKRFEEASEEHGTPLWEVDKDRAARGIFIDDGNVAHVNGTIETPRMVIEAAPRRTGRTFRSWLCNYFK